MRINIDPLESQVMAGEERSHIKGKCIKGASKIGNIRTYENGFFGMHVFMDVALMITFWIPGAHAYIFHISDAVK